MVAKAERGRFKKKQWAVDYDLIRGFRSFVVGLVRWHF